MEYKAHTYPYSLYLRHYLVLLQLLFLLLLPIGTLNNIISNENFVYEDEDDAPTCATTNEHVRIKSHDVVNKEDQNQQSDRDSKQCPVVFQHPAECNCPITLEPEDFKQLKDNLAPVIRHRLRELLNKALTVESANEAAHTIDLLKLLDESNSELNMIRDKVHDGAQQLRAAFEKIPEYIHVTN